MTDDYYMPQSVASSLGAFVDGIWIELQIQIMQIIKGVLHVRTLDKRRSASVHDSSICCSCCNAVTAWYRYHVEPFDKTIWGKLRDPVWLILFVLNLVPYLGFQTILYTIKFILIERKDDFQCINYIENFKSLQAVQGIFLIIRGVVKFLRCAGLEDTTSHTCHIDGPGILSDDNIVCEALGTNFCFWMSTAEFMIKVLLVYAAYFCLANSSSLGGKVRGREGRRIPFFSSFFSSFFFSIILLLLRFAV